MRRATDSAPAHKMSSTLEVAFPLRLSSLQPKSKFQGRALLLLGLPVRATILGLGALPNPPLEAVNLTMALGTGPLAEAF